LCAGGTFSAKPGAASCQQCTAGYFCPPGCSAGPFGVPCGAGNYCPAGSSAPTPCPTFGAVDPIKGPSNGPAFDVDVAACLNHCVRGGYLCARLRTPAAAAAPLRTLSLSHTHSHIHTHTHTAVLWRQRAGVYLLTIWISYQPPAASRWGFAADL
jgi:hypothetical protein